MANTLHGPYAKTTWTNGSTPISQSNLNNLEGQSGVALHSFNPHMIGAGFVLSGATCTKDGTNANQLDIASGEAYLIQSDGTPTLCDIAADNTHTTTGNPSTTMYLDLNPDGSWSWSTSHSAVTNHLTICSVTTDASANIATVVDTRPTAVSLLSTMAGILTLPTVTSPGLIASHYGYVGGSGPGDLLDTAGTGSATGAGGSLFFKGANNGTGFWFQVPNGTNVAHLDQTGAWAMIGQQASVGSFGVPVIVAQAIDVHVTATTLQTILSYTPSVTGIYRISGSFYQGNTVGEKIFMQLTYTSPHAAGASTPDFILPGATTSLDGVNTTVSNGFDWPVVPYQHQCKAGSPITVTYQDPANTPNDFVSVLIERLA